MPQGNSHDIKVLNGLAANLSDSADTYREASSELDDPGYRQWFEARANDRASQAAALHQEIEQRGGTPEGEPSIIAKAQRAFKDVKQALLRNDTSVVDTIRSSDEGLLKRFSTALDDQALSATTRETIRRIKAQIEAGQEQISALQQSLNSHRDQAQS